MNESCNLHDPTAQGRRLRIEWETEPVDDILVDASTEEGWTILVHNDDVTPYDFVIETLRRIFILSEEIAETVTWEAHSKGVAPVCTRPKSVAEKLIAAAHALARANGFPLTFSLESKS
ncbi:MAG: ATP-dependent Clp protease adaptor ClpS [Caldilineaceae bacterium]|nr:ATP-dependent Clp protease adaptor ClpS [Caldilineaceae bacterium]MCY4091606.1 ATP-dependent Clp protease adaptor ClpS [Caldilineaceae bacterium]MCY4115938.1 ATP-dependent Clp protease adaptor ClpS [Caldilineaceae bacterium]MDE0428737.1 ATP-dependent Clp protease adaptor ClpS [Caldilineaceae bacterium]